LLERLLKSLKYLHTIAEVEIHHILNNFV